MAHMANLHPSSMATVNTVNTINHSSGPTHNKTTKTIPKKLFIAGIPPLTSKADIVEAIQSQFKNVPVYNVRIPRKQKLGFAYLDIATEKGYNILLNAKFISIKGRDVLIKPFQKGSNLGKFKDDINKRRLFVYSLPPSMKNNELFTLFSEHGNVEDAYIIKNRTTGKSKGFGYVVYEKEEEAERMIEKKTLKFKRKKIWIKLHEKPNKKKKIPKETSCLNNNRAGSGSSGSTAN